MSLYKLPEKYAEEKFVTYPEVKTYVERILKWIFDPNDVWCLYVWGKAGSGKTHFAISALKQFNKSSMNQGIFLPVRNYFKMMQNNFGDTAEARRLDKALQETDLLVLDDFEAYVSTDWKSEKINSLLFDRYDEKKKTIITSNVSLAEYHTKTKDDRLTRRIGEGCEIPYKSSKYLKTNRNALEKDIV